MPYQMNVVGAVAAGTLLLSLSTTLVLAVRVRRLRAERERVVAGVREGFARDMHDIVGHWLWLASVKGELARRHADGDARLHGELEEVLQAVRQATRAVRNVSAAYRGLSLPAEAERARVLLRGFGAYCSVRMEVADLPGEVSAALGTVVREGITNVLRHSRATRCAIELVECGGGLRLTVVNDGAPRRDPVGTGSGSGLDNLRHRVGELGGTVQVSDGTDGWFTLIAEVPVNHSEGFSRLLGKRRWSAV
ncbi:two-component system sensor histidine kinase DesK [Streptosporangium becharense]|uniref:Two-component system sensor histidine kinase DesK n=1 Tax=Streptosporangium becharense TaxID=1816182 RepID=A0A7W9MJL9_9ACTN|nr:histidine kinase [Streptosporangium becharense]MBB2911553.1 two-component system sensor histidine kinase DesK [Streptosporangium becharense]MBB5822629.1 two-component system sensor histidine kinase DesK [Streptosporangium becharense]